MRTAIIACVDASPVLDFGEQALDQAPLFVGRLVVAILHFAVSFWRDAGSDPACCQRGAEPVAVMAFGAQKLLGVG